MFKRFMLMLVLLAMFVPSSYAGMAPPDQIVIEMTMPTELATVEDALDDLACRGRLIRGFGRGVRGLGRALTPFRHHR